MRRFLLTRIVIHFLHWLRQQLLRRRRPRFLTFCFIIILLGIFYGSQIIPSWILLLKENDPTTENDTTKNNLGPSLYRPKPLDPNCIPQTTTKTTNSNTQQGIVFSPNDDDNDNDYYCEWDTTLESCYHMLMKELYQRPSWVFLGDVNMAQIVYYISVQWPFETSSTNITSLRQSCENLEYYTIFQRLPSTISILPTEINSIIDEVEVDNNNNDLKEGIKEEDEEEEIEDVFVPSFASSTTSWYPSWKTPDPIKGEGPINFGKIHPYCTDCQKCWNVRMNVIPSQDGPTTRSSQSSSSSSSSSPKPRSSSSSSTSSSSTSSSTSQFVEYLVVEYARDVTLQTETTRTTQETVAKYLATQSPTVCIASAGLNDMGITTSILQSPLPMDMYLQNVQEYITLLTQSCQSVIWIGLHAIVEEEESEQYITNCDLYEWNQAVYRMLKQKKSKTKSSSIYSNVYIIDIWNKSLQTDHIIGSPLQLHRKFYAILARLFVTLMAGPDQQQQGRRRTTRTKSTRTKSTAILADTQEINIDGNRRRGRRLNHRRPTGDGGDDDESYQWNNVMMDQHPLRGIFDTYE